jgi:hypothetical protein
MVFTKKWGFTKYFTLLTMLSVVLGFNVQSCVHLPFMREKGSGDDHIMNIWEATVNEGNSKGILESLELG